MNSVYQWLEEENEFLKETSEYLIECSKAVIVSNKEYTDKELKYLNNSHSQKLSQLSKQVLTLEAEIVKKDEIIKSQSKKITTITEKHNAEVKSHVKTQQFVTECKNVISSLEEELSILKIHSESEKKKLETMYNLLKQEVKQKSVKCSKLKAENQILHEDKENCQMKLECNQKAAKELNRKYKKENNIINQKMLNANAQYKQMKFLSELNSQPVFL